MKHSSDPTSRSAETCAKILRAPLIFHGLFFFGRPFSSLEPTDIVIAWAAGRNREAES